MGVVSRLACKTKRCWRCSVWFVRLVEAVGLPWSRRNGLFLDYLDFYGLEVTKSAEFVPYLLRKGFPSFNNNTTESSRTVLDRTTTRSYTSFRRERIDSMLAARTKEPWVSLTKKREHPQPASYKSTIGHASRQGLNPPTVLRAIYIYWSLWIGSRLMNSYKQCKCCGYTLNTARFAFGQADCTECNYQIGRLQRKEKAEGKKVSRQEARNRLNGVRNEN